MEDSLAAAVAAEVRAELARKKLTQSALGAAMGRSPNTITGLLNNARPIDMNEIVVIGMFVGITPLELMTHAVERMS